LGERAESENIISQHASFEGLLVSPQNRPSVENYCPGLLGFFLIFTSPIAVKQQPRSAIHQQPSQSVLVFTESNKQASKQPTNNVPKLAASHPATPQ
jgi:hypothetical protein